MTGQTQEQTVTYARRRITLSVRLLITKSRSACFTFITLLSLTMSLALSNPVHAQQNTQAAPTASTTPAPKEKGDDSVGCALEHNLVNLTVTVSNKYGLPVTGLTKNDFTVYDNDEKQDIRFFSNEDVPASIGIVFNIGGSMSGDKVGRVFGALKKFFEIGHHETEFFLLGFNPRAMNLLNKNLSETSDTVLNRLTFVETKEIFYLYDACYLGIEKVLGGKHQKHALLVIDDGMDSNARLTFKELNRILKESDALIYTIDMTNPDYSFTTISKYGNPMHDEMALITGGKAFSAKNVEEMDDALNRIATELRHQYSIGYEPSNFTNNGRWRKVRVKVQQPRSQPRLNVRTREGYYATTNPR